MWPPTRDVRFTYVDKKQIGLLAQSLSILQFQVLILRYQRTVLFSTLQLLNSISNEKSGGHDTVTMIMIWAGAEQNSMYMNNLEDSNLRLYPG